MFDFKSVVLPVTLGIFGGLLSPILVEKWRGSEDASKKQIVIEERLQKVEEKTNNLSVKLEEHVASMEPQLKKLEVNMSNNAGILKGRQADLPLETPSVK